MAEAQYAHNHVINPETGYLENPAYVYDFDSDRKKQFLKRFEENCLGLYDTCEQLGLSHHTVNKHYQIDAQFREAYDETRRRYLDRVQAVGRMNALNPRSVVERIWVQKTNSDLPGFERYADQKNTGNINVSINIDQNVLDSIKKRQEVIDIEPVSE